MATGHMNVRIPTSEGDTRVRAEILGRTPSGLVAVMARSALHPYVAKGNAKLGTCQQSNVVRNGPNAPTGNCEKGAVIEATLQDGSKAAVVTYDPKVGDPGHQLVPLAFYSISESTADVIAGLRPDLLAGIVRPPSTDITYIDGTRSQATLSPLLRRAVPAETVRSSNCVTGYPKEAFSIDNPIAPQPLGKLSLRVCAVNGEAVVVGNNGQSSGGAKIFAGGRDGPIEFDGIDVGGNFTVAAGSATAVGPYRTCYMQLNVPEGVSALGNITKGRIYDGTRVSDKQIVATVRCGATDGSRTGGQWAVVRVGSPSRWFPN